MSSFYHLDNTDNLLPQTQWRRNKCGGPRPDLIAQPREGKKIDREEEQLVTGAKEKENFLWRGEGISDLCCQCREGGREGGGGTPTLFE